MTGGGRESVVESPGKSIITRRTMRGRGEGGEPTSKGGEEGFKFAINAGRNDRTRVTRTRG